MREEEQEILMKKRWNVTPFDGREIDFRQIENAKVFLFILIGNQNQKGKIQE